MFWIFSAGVWLDTPEVGRYNLHVRSLEQLREVEPLQARGPQRQPRPGERAGVGEDGEQLHRGPAPRRGCVGEQRGGGGGAGQLRARDVGHQPPGGAGAGLHQQHGVQEPRPPPRPAHQAGGVANQPLLQLRAQVDAVLRPRPETCTSVQLCIHLLCSDATITESYSHRC